jgi:predicted nuclease of restriction endonuclease-like (RecB) superfamily
LQQPVAKLLVTSEAQTSKQSYVKPPPGLILHQPGAKLARGNDVAAIPQIALQLPWKHNVLLFEKLADLGARLWYMRQTILNGWSRDVLSMMIGSQAHRRQGKAITNFPEHFPPAQSDLAVQTLKDPYIFDFLVLEEPFREQELETELLRHFQKFLLALGQGFAFVGRQYPIDIGGETYYIDLLFYHLHLRCFVLIDLKKGAFKAEFAGKMNLYLNVIDDALRHPADSPSIGLILCQDHNRVVAEYALRGMKSPIGISEYKLTRALPKEFRSSLPTIEEIEAELTEPARKVKRTKPLKNRLLSKNRGKR